MMRKTHLMNELEALRALPGEVALYVRPLDGGPAVACNEDHPMTAASVIKLAVMVEAFARFADGSLDANEEITVPPEAKKPSCGVLTYLHDGLRVSVRDLVVLMIIVSDNTATNLLIDRLGIPAVNRRMEALGVPGIVLRRRLFETAPEYRGLVNHVTARGVGELLWRMARGELLGEPWDGEMVKILLDQRLNGKFPFHLHAMGAKIAHKTGEDTGTTHDVGIFYAKRPFVMCVLSNHTDVAACERFMQDAALSFFERAGGMPDNN